MSEPRKICVKNYRGDGSFWTQEYTECSGERFCPGCGKRGDILKEDGEGDYYSGPRFVCLACGADGDRWDSARPSEGLRKTLAASLVAGAGAVSLFDAARNTLLRHADEHAPDRLSRSERWGWGPRRIVLDDGTEIEVTSIWLQFERKGGKLWRHALEIAQPFDKVVPEELRRQPG